MAFAPAVGREVTLDDRYALERGTVLMTGVQALVRLLLDQLAADRADGARIGAFVSGYQGSPLGGLDLELARQRDRCAELGIVHRPGVNEELAATAVWGSQLAPDLDGATADGVLGVWYGKAPGADRAADALRHANHVGAHPRGGLLAVCGDDPACKSSTLPSASESLFAALRIPTFYPGTPQEVLDLGRHAIAASRASGLCVALKLVANVADGVATVDVDPARVRPVAPPGPRHRPTAALLPPTSLEVERSVNGPRIAVARAYARANGLNRVVLDAPEARLGIVAAGAAYQELHEALHLLGVTEADLRERGVRVLKLDVLWPLDGDALRAFADGLDEIVVLDEKGPFIESALRSALYDLGRRPRVVGEHDEHGDPLLPSAGSVDADVIASVVGPRLGATSMVATSGAAARPSLPAVGVLRTPYFCSGCPHNRSTEAPADALVGAGIGCHGMMSLFPEGRGRVTGLTQMGGEGAQWIGQAPFTSTSHLFQNLGDGTFAHSGSLAIRAAVAAGVNITYKLLYNGVVAMTGAQATEGAMSVPDLTRWLELEGVRRVIVTTDEPERYEGVALAASAEVRPRTELLAAQRELAQVPGVTVLVHDQACAADKGRLRRRGKLPQPRERIAINERVCEGCGDCGRKSHCVSLLPVETELGRKTRIQQSSCNLDTSCVEGDCPSFLRVVPGEGGGRETPPPPSGLARPELGDEALVRLVGIGGTGVVTIAQVLGMAALLDGKRVTGLDQTGLSQKGGSVVSDVRILRADAPRSGRAARASVDAYLAFDLLGATTPANLATVAAGRTIAIVSTSEVPTGQMIGDPEARMPALEQAQRRIDDATGSERNVYLDAVALAETLFGTHMAANSVVLGAAWQAGAIPLSLEAIEEAFRLNGVSVERNLAAFGWGRAVVAAPDAVAELTRPAPVRLAPDDDRVAPIVASTGAPAGSELERTLRLRVADLLAYQGARYARSYAGFVGEVRAAADEEVATVVARQLHRLMAYKDEYEVARLHLDPEERRRIEREFGAGATVRYQLHPPLLRALGMRRKLSLGPWFDPALRLLRALRFLRGTPLDPFGYARVRRVERELPGEYRELVTHALAHVAQARAEVLELCELPEVVRGYEEVKLRNVETFRRRARELQDALDAPPALEIVTVAGGSR